MDKPKHFLLKGMDKPKHFFIKGNGPIRVHETGPIKIASFYLSHYPIKD